MALRDQPYLPLYIQDFMTDEKLLECGPSATGIYIRIMCIMHKSEEYGTVLLKQKDKQNSSIHLNFANKLAKAMPYSINDIVSGLDELLSEGVLQIKGDKLIQKRMVKDCAISEERSKAGKKGHQKNNFASAKTSTNSENENENENKIIQNGVEDELRTVNVYKNIENYKDAFLKDVFAVGSIAQKGVNRNYISGWLDAFNKFLIITQDTYKDQTGYIRHFLNWLPKIPNYKTMNPEDYSPVKDEIPQTQKESSSDRTRQLLASKK